MEVTFTTQLIRFISCAVIGFCMGFLYDLCSILTVLFKAKCVVFITDLLFSLCLCGAVYAYIALYGGGEVRFFLIVGGLFGLILHYIAITKVVKKSGQLIKKLLRTVRGATRIVGARGDAMRRKLDNKFEDRKNKLISSKIFTRRKKNNYFK